MKQKIVDYCKKIEHDNNVKILFAIESGSRLWRMDSEDSDYDVRYVFVQPIKNYLSLDGDKARELVINNEYEDKMVDFSGFDIFKFCRLLLKSNPTILEWLQSDIVYYGKKPQGLLKIATEQFSPAALYYHYRSMCKQNYEKYLASKKLVTYKKYLYSMRGLVNAKYVESTGKLPLIKFPEMLDKCQGIIPKKVIDELKDTITKKKLGKEKEIIKNSPTYDPYIEKFLKDKNTSVEVRKISKKDLNKELQKIIFKNG